jgi:hypothetical protein
MMIMNKEENFSIASIISIMINDLRFSELT